MPSIPPLSECLARAAAAREQAERSSLMNVREQCLNAAKVWQDMADQKARYGDGQGR